MQGSGKKRNRALPSKVVIGNNALTGKRRAASPINASIDKAYEAADRNRYNADLPIIDYTAQDVIAYGAEKVRARARQLERNNDTVRRALHLAEQNIVGPKGFKLTSMARKTATGKKPDEAVNTLIEDRWKAFEKNPLLLKKYKCFRGLQKMAVRRYIVDGEAFVEMLPGFDNEWRFNLRVIDAMYIPIDVYDKNKRICMGVEYDEDLLPIAYYVADNKGEYSFNSSLHGVSSRSSKNKYRRVEAANMVHWYNMERPNQHRGISMIASPMERLHMLDKFEEATLTGARVAASKMGFFYDELNDDNPEPYTGNDEEELKDPETGESYDAQNVLDIEAGQFEDIGTKRFEKFDVNFPPARYEEFTTSILRSISSGLNISYFKLSNDLSDVNYSTAREAKLDDVDAWRDNQFEMIDVLNDPIYSSWLNIQTLTPGFSGVANLSLERLLPHRWQPRGWQWIDPQKEMAAIGDALDRGLTSESIVAEERGMDYEEILKTRQRDQQLREKYGISESNPDAMAGTLEKVNGQWIIRAGRDNKLFDFA